MPTLAQVRKLRKIKGGGKPDKFSQAKVISALKQAHGVQSLAARILGCHRDTVTRYIEVYPKIRAVYLQAPEEVTDIAEGHLIRAVVSGDPENVRWWLRTKGRHRGYGDQVQHTGEGGGPIQIDVSNLERKLARIVDATLVKDALKPG